MQLVREILTEAERGLADKQERESIVTTEQFKALAKRRYDKVEPLQKPGEKATYKVVQVFKDLSFLERVQQEREVEEDASI